MSRLSSLLMRALVAMLAAGIFYSAAAEAAAERIKDLATIAGVRENQLVGYGLVVGLDGSGDQTTQTPFTKQSIVNMLGNMGVTVPQGTNMQLKNVAAVMVTASLPPFARPGQPMDVTVSSIGNAKSLRGGTLVMTPLKGADGQVYAVAQGNLVVGGAGGAAGGAAQTINHLAAGRIPGGATIERGVAASVGQGDFVMVELNDADFNTARRVVDAINGVAPGAARALDARSIQVLAPVDVSQRVSFLGQLENLKVTPGEQVAKVIVKSRTGSVVMNQRVTLQNVAVSHGNLTVTVNSETQVSQPAPFSQGVTVAAQNQGQVDIRQDGGSIHNVRAGGNLADVVKALNALGAKPMDLVSILQAMKAAGALRAELEVI